MIISRTPFRISFAGGGTDLPGYFLEEEGAVLSTAINKYMYITVNPRFDSSVRLSYSKTEIHDKVESVEHPIFKSVLKRHLPHGGVEIISMADVPAGTGLGSSSSFTVGLLHAVKAHKGLFQTAENLASEACDIEINELREPIGKQDQYISSFGGLQFIRFRPDGKVWVDPIVCSDQTKKDLHSGIQLFYTGVTRAAKTVLEEQKNNVMEKRDVLRQMTALARALKAELESAQSLERFGRLLNEAWQLKKSMATNVSNSKIDQWYERAIKAGAWGGKILGAGSGGFLMTFSKPELRSKIAAELSELKPFDMELETQGSKILFVG